MDRPVRIVVAGPVDDRLVGELRQLPLRPEVRPSPSVLADSEAILRFRPDILLLGLDRDHSEEIGALRLLQQMWPALAVVLVAPPDRETSLAPLATRLRALLLPFPDAPGQLAAILEQARLRSDRPRADVFFDLARGVADEINNPLMVASGQLQLLRASFEAAPERNRRDQVGAAMAALERVHAAVERLRQLAAAASGPRQYVPLDLRQMLDQALAARAGSAPRPPANVTNGPHSVLGDRDQLAPALAVLVQFTSELADAGAVVELLLDATTLVVTARGEPLAAWVLPQTFEPYYPSRALRGQSQGLGLAFVQAVVLGHRGQATVRRLADGSLRFEFTLHREGDGA
jgi:signal transduction histidine kinase